MKREPIRIATLFTLLLGLCAPSQGRSESARTHVVDAGQHLGSIAKRYGVTLDALTRANRLRNDIIRPGQRLIIPAKAQSARPKEGAAARPAGGNGARHRVEAGQRLESIARRYHVSVTDLCNANGISREAVIRPGQSLTIPRAGGGAARADGQSLKAKASASAKTPALKGRITLVSHSQRFEGFVFDKKGKLIPRAASGIQRVLAMGGARPQAAPRLFRLLVAVSDRFGGRPLRIVSGYRARSFFEASKHKSSRAVDFSIPGISNEVLRDYLRSIPNVGVGYYPNSSFVHLDVREYSAYWVDYAGPGEAPRSSALARQNPEPTAPEGQTLAPADSLTLPTLETLSQTRDSLLAGFSEGFFAIHRERAARPTLPSARPPRHGLELP